MNKRAIAICPMREALSHTRSPLQVDYAGAPSPVDTPTFCRYTFGNWREPMSDSPLPNAKLTVVPPSPEDQVRKAAAHDRYALDAASAKLLKENGRRAVLKMFEMLNDEEKWEGMGPRNQMALIDMAITRAFGRVETVSADAKLADATSEVAGALPHHLRLLAGTLNLPELQGAKSAKKD